MKQRIFYHFLVFILSCVFVFITFHTVSAAKNKYFYRQRANWVKLKKLSKKQMAGQSLNHPHTVSTSDVASMLKGLKLQKGQLFKKQDKDAELFSEPEVRKFAPYIATALSEAAPNQVVNVAVVHKRPYFILRNDYITIFNFYVIDGHAHVYFQKLFAKLEGDYKQASQIDEAIRKAKSPRLALKAAPDIQLLQNGKEAVFALADWSLRSVEGQDPVDHSVEPTVATQSPVIPADDSVGSRLQTLQQLKDSKLISNKEYQEKRRQILDQL